MRVREAEKKNKYHIFKKSQDEHSSKRRHNHINYIEIFTTAFSEKFIRISFEDETKKKVIFR
jgi:hypothetical protein